MRRAATATTILALFLMPACVRITDTRRSVSGTAPESEDGELLEGAERLDHVLWEAIAARYVSAEGVAYEELAASGESRFVLRQYLEMLGAVDPRGLDGAPEKLAFYVNLYNATVVEGVVAALEEDPDFRVDVDSFAFFDEPLVSLEGLLVSLNVLEHALLRGKLGHSSASVAGLDGMARDVVTELHDDLWGGEAIDPRIHFLLNCASRSCPPLGAAALTGDGFDSAAEDGTSAFVADPERGTGPDGISQIFDWFREDFTAAGFDDPADFIGAYRDLDGVRTDALLPYDWSLNSWVRS